MGQRGSRGQCQAGHHRHNRGKGHGSHHGQHEVAHHALRPPTQQLRQHGRGQIAALVQAQNRAGADIQCGRKADHHNEQMAQADGKHGVQCRFAGGLRMWHGEKAHQDMWHGGGSQHQCHTQRNLFDRVFQIQARFQKALSGFGHTQRRLPQEIDHMILDGGAGNDRAKKRFHIKAVGRPGQNHQHEAETDQQTSLEHLHRGGGTHATK